MYDGNEKKWRRFQLRSFVVAFLLLSSCHCSPTAELLEAITRILTHCLRFYPHADRNMAENLNVRLEVAVDSVRRLVELIRWTEVIKRMTREYHILNPW